MRRKIDVTPAKMLELREQGLSNHDIARSLDISVQTVWRYIGKQNGRMGNLAGFSDTPPKRKPDGMESLSCSYGRDKSPTLSGKSSLK